MGLQCELSCWSRPSKRVCELWRRQLSSVNWTFGENQFKSKSNRFLPFLFFTSNVRKGQFLWPCGHGAAVAALPWCRAVNLSPLTFDPLDYLFIKEADMVTGCDPSSKITTDFLLEVGKMDGSRFQIWNLSKPAAAWASCGSQGRSEQTVLVWSDETKNTIK